MTKILLVDDNPAQHELFRAYSVSTDIEISHAISVQEAIRILERITIEIVFLDNRLFPHADFRETVPLIREAGFSGRIIVISSDVRHPIFEEVRLYSVHSCLNKFEITLANFSNLVHELGKKSVPLQKPVNPQLIEVRS